MIKKMEVKGIESKYNLGKGFSFETPSLICQGTAHEFPLHLINFNSLD